MIRKLAALAVFAAVLAAAPRLVTVQDVIYKADGSPFNGLLFIEWKSFEAQDASLIGMQSVTAPVVNGVLRVQLVPTVNANPAAWYQVRYNSDGKFQFEEYWAVPLSNTPLRLRDVRIPSPLKAGSVTTPPPIESNVPESAVTGLVEDLAMRPVKGAGYAPSRAAVIAADGTLEAVAGDLGDCVRVDGTSGPCGAPAGGPGFVDGETPGGAVDGSNLVFTLSRLPSPAESLSVYRNGILQKQGFDYNVSAGIITFETAGAPQPGDVLVANYRTADSAHPQGAAGGALAGEFPNPSLAAGVVTDANVAGSAAIRESKLALNYPTHSSVNDPSPGEKSALAGSYGVPAASNRYVTEQDPRLSAARTPSAHPLLGSAHSDTSAAAPVRGDLLVAQGSAPAQWARMPIGPAGRCLVSNGSDALWNPCLYTGFATGAVPFVDASGNLAQNAARLVWDNNNRKLSVGNNSGASTLFVHDAQSSTGSTELTVRAGQGQGTDPLQRWLSAAGAELGRIDADGRIQLPAFRAASTGARAAWQDAGTLSDPAAPENGDQWFNSAAAAHKQVHAGQAHPVAQVICSSTGTTTASSSMTRLGSCTLPAGLLKAGDRVEIHFDYAHSGVTADFAVELAWGGTPFFTRTLAAPEAALSGRASAAVYATGAQLSVQAWGTAAAASSGAASSGDNVAAPITVEFRGRLVSGGADTVSLRGFTVVRYPAQQNP